MEPPAARQRLGQLARVVETVDRDTPLEALRALRREISELYRSVDAYAREYAELRVEVRVVGERFRERERLRRGDDPRWERAQREAGAGELELATHLERAWSHIAACRYEAALEVAGRALARAPGHVRASVLRGWALMRMGRLGEAREVLEGVLAAAPEDSLARAALGYVAVAEGREGEADALLQVNAASGGDRTATLYSSLFLGMLFVRRGRFEDARTHLSRALAVGPALAEAHWEMGRAYYLEGRFEEARVSWRLGAEVNRYDPWGERCQEAAERADGGIAVPVE